jgi:hypothetical protein
MLQIYSYAKRVRARCSAECRRRWLGGLRCAAEEPERKKKRERQSHGRWPAPVKTSEGSAAKQAIKQVRAGERRGEAARRGGGAGTTESSNHRHNNNNKEGAYKCMQKPGLCYANHKAAISSLLSNSSHVLRDNVHTTMYTRTLFFFCDEQQQAVKERKTMLLSKLPRHTTEKRTHDNRQDAPTIPRTPTHRHFSWYME